MNSTIPEMSRRAARWLLAGCFLATAWYGYYQLGHILRLVLIQLGQFPG
jgi:hypothetical protein